MTFPTIVLLYTHTVKQWGKKMYTLQEQSIIDKALNIISEKLATYETEQFNAPKEVKRFFNLKLAHLEHEVFMVMFLDAQKKLIHTTELFRGTIDQSSVYPREVVKEALKHNAHAVIFAHNHPSGDTTPSQADERITHRLRDALNLIDTAVLDHIIVGKDKVISMAELGLI